MSTGLTPHQLRLSAKSIALLQQLPQSGGVGSLFKYFALMLETPRPSKKLDTVRDRLIDVARQLNLEVDTDKGGNVRIRKPATPGRENAPCVVMQAHMDVVCSKNRDTVHNFETDAVDAYVDGHWLKANGTTLGADNGIGVAAALAVMEDPTLQHGPLECLFTADEEDDFFGVENLAPAPFLRSTVLFNLDSEEEGEICIGSAGGFEAHMLLPVQRESSVPPNLVRLGVAVRGLVGGHTGGDIHRGRGNALIVLARVLSFAAEDASGTLRLVSYEGGTGPSAICREADAVVMVDGRYVAAVRERLQREAEIAFAEIADEEPSPKLVLSEPEAAAAAAAAHVAPLTVESTQRALHALLLLPHGVIRVRGAHTETSIAFSVCELRERELFCHLFARSCISSQLRATEQRLQALASVLGAQCKAPLQAFPAWQPDQRSQALIVVREQMKRLFNIDARVYVVHGGLECGSIKGLYPSMDCVSFGPTIRGAHSPDERLEIPTVARFYALLTSSLEAISRPSA